MKWSVSFPEESILLVRPCLVAICHDNRPAAKLLSVLLYRHSIRQEHQSDAESINEVRGDDSQDITFRIYRKQSKLVTDMCNEITEKTLHDVAVPVLQLLGYLDVDETPTIHCYDLHVDIVVNALEAYKQGPKQLQQTLQSNLQLEKFLINIQLEKVLINKKNFQLALEKVLIANRNISNNKRGRKPKPEAPREPQSEEPQINIEIDSKIGNREEGVGSPEPTAPALFIHPEHSFLAFDSLEHPTLMVISFVDDDRAEITNKARARIAETQAYILETKGCYVQIRKEHESVDTRTIDAPANVYHLEEKRQKRETDPRMKAVKIGDTNADHDTSHSRADHGDGLLPAGPSDTLRREEQQDDGASSQRHAQEAESELNTSLSSLGTPAPAQRSESLSPNAAVQGANQDKPPMALTAQQIAKQNEQRKEEIMVLYAAKIGRKPSRSKSNLDGALKLAQDEVSDQDINTTIDAILKDDFLAKNLTLTFVYSKLDAFARKPIPLHQSNGTKPATQAEPVIPRDAIRAAREAREKRIAL